MAMEYVFHLCEKEPLFVAEATLNSPNERGSFFTS
jgi:hypothetical protein